MQAALQEAREAAASGEVPIGAVVVFENRIVGRGRNAVERGPDPTTHAELAALRQAAAALGRWRLAGCTMYVTVEPCPMCAMACVWARLDRLVYGAPDPKAGGAGSLYELPEDPRLNHQVRVERGVLAEEAGDLMRAFFRRRRPGPDL